jgi:hypothetical protein
VVVVVDVIVDVDVVDVKLKEGVKVAFKTVDVDSRT